MTSSERPGCATSIREAGEVTMEVRLLALPPEPPVGSEVELRMPTYSFPYIRGVSDGVLSAWGERSWRPNPSIDARGSALAWRELCAQALGGELWLTREGPATTKPEEGT